MISQFASFGFRLFAFHLLLINGSDLITNSEKRRSRSSLSLGSELYIFHFRLLFGFAWARVLPTSMNWWQRSAAGYRFRKFIAMETAKFVRLYGLVLDYIVWIHNGWPAQVVDSGLSGTDNAIRALTNCIAFGVTRVRATWLLSRLRTPSIISDILSINECHNRIENLCAAPLYRHNRVYWMDLDVICLSIRTTHLFGSSDINDVTDWMEWRTHSLQRETIAAHVSYLYSNELASFYDFRFPFV